MVGRAFLGSFVVTLVLIGAGTAGAQIPPGGRVAPDQRFIGLVNGESGVESPVAVSVACPGPIRPGQTGHAVRNQPLKVVQSEAIARSGNTGPQGTLITAFLTVPAATSTTKKKALTTFWHYDVNKMIPTSASMPCAGSGVITFTPFPRDPPASRPYVVRVTFTEANPG